MSLVAGRFFGPSVFVVCLKIVEKVVKNSVSADCIVLLDGTARGL